MLKPSELPRDPRQERLDKKQPETPKPPFLVPECYASIYRRFKCTPSTDDQLPERLLECYNQHYYASFEKMYLPAYEKLRNFHTMVLDALV
jgi:hypothetical protein